MQRIIHTRKFFTHKSYRSQIKLRSKPKKIEKRHKFNFQRFQTKKKHIEFKLIHRKN